MGLFDNITFMNEGEQADAYKLRKEAEKDEKYQSERNRFEHRYSRDDIGSKYTDEYKEAQNRKNPNQSSLVQHMNNLAIDSKRLKDKIDRNTGASIKIANDADENPERDKQRDYNAAKKSGLTKAEVDRIRKIDDWDYEETEDDKKFMDNLAKTKRGQDYIMNRGQYQAADAINRHMRRHPDQYKESGIFESVNFINGTSDFIIECNLIDSDNEIMNEAVVFKFVKKNEVPGSFKDEALKICKYLEEESGKKGTSGALASSIKGTFGIRVNNASKKIEKGKLKNCYILGFSYSAITKAAGVERKIFDKFFINGKLVQDYMAKVLQKLGYNKISEKAGANWGYYKNKDGYICGVDCTVIDSVVNIYIRCLTDCEENREVLAGGKHYK